MKIFNFENLNDHDLYHLRYGKGAVIVAVLKQQSDMNQDKWDELQEERHRQASSEIKPLEDNIAVLKKSRPHLGTLPEIREQNHAGLSANGASKVKAWICESSWNAACHAERSRSLSPCPDAIRDS